jgi:hypothetical protein
VSVQTEAARLYRRTMRGEVTPADCCRITPLLSLLARLAEQVDLKVRIAAGNARDRGGRACGRRTARRSVPGHVEGDGKGRFIGHGRGPNGMILSHLCPLFARFHVANGL